MLWLRLRITTQSFRDLVEPIAKLIQDAANQTHIAVTHPIEFVI